MNVWSQICVMNSYTMCVRWRQSCRILALRVLDKAGGCDAEKQMARYCWCCHTGRRLFTHSWSASQVKRVTGFGFDKCGYFLRAGTFLSCAWSALCARFWNDSLLNTKIHCFASRFISVFAGWKSLRHQNQLKLIISRTKYLVVDFHASDMDFVSKNL